MYSYGTTPHGIAGPIGGLFSPGMPAARRKLDFSINVKDPFSP